MYITLQEFEMSTNMVDWAVAQFNKLVCELSADELGLFWAALAQAYPHNFKGEADCLRQLEAQGIVTPPTE